MFTPEEASDVADVLLRRTMSVLDESGLEYDVVLASREDAVEFERRYGKKVSYFQRGEGLGCRMLNAMADAHRAYERMLLIGSDLVNLDAETVYVLEKLLDDYDVALSPTEDGGYGAIAMKELHPEAFDVKEYSTSTVAQETVRLLENSGKRVAIGPRLRDIDTVEDIVQELTGSKAELLGYGEYNINYRVGNAVFRLNLASQIGLGKRQAAYEYGALKLLENSGATPRPIKFYASGSDGGLLPRDGFTMEYIEGRPLDYDSDLSIAAELLAKIHSTNLPENHGLIKPEAPFREMFEECERMFSVYADWERRDPEVCRLVGELFKAEQAMGLDDLPAEAVIINTELNNTNFIIGKDRNVVIDWEKPIVGDREQDLAHFVVPTTTFFRTDKILSQKEIDYFLAEYERYAPFDRNRFYKYFVFTCLRGITWCAMAKVEYSGERAVRRDETASKLDSYLDYNFLKRIAKIGESLN